MVYEGVADVAYVAIASSNGKFGGLRAGNTSFFGSKGLTGIYAPGVQFTGPLYIGDINAFDSATPMLIFDSVSDARITGGDLLQSNSQAIQLKGLAQLKFTAGSDSHGSIRPARINLARFEQNGVNVTAQVVVNPPP